MATKKGKDVDAVDGSFQQLESGNLSKIPALLSATNSFGQKRTIDGYLNVGLVAIRLLLHTSCHLLDKSYDFLLFSHGERPKP